MLIIFYTLYAFKDLENYMRNHPESRLKKIQEIGKQLIDSNIMTSSIEADVEGLTNRWENLNKQVRTSFMYYIPYVRILPFSCLFLLFFLFIKSICLALCSHTYISLF